MRKNRAIAIVIPATIFLYMFSCIKPASNFDPRDGNNVYSNCRIKTVTEWYGYPPASSYYRLYEYNNNNDPVKVTVGPYQGMGLPDLYFKYDNKKRLTEFGADFHVATEYDFQFIHRYGYLQNRISTDTVYELGFFDARRNPVNYVNKFLKYLTYDNLNRIVQDSMIIVFPAIQGPAIVGNISYDANGNRIILDPKLQTRIPYDNKLNPARTNYVWMFITRNYSLNNPIGATSYNIHGLPLTFSPEQAGNKPPVLIISGPSYSDSTVVEYDCR